MDKKAFDHLINFNLSINTVSSKGGSLIADELIRHIESLQVKISPLLVNNPKAHAYVAKSGKMSLMSTLCSLGESNEDMTVSDQIRVLEAAFTGNGPFAGVEFPVFKTEIDQPKFLASCYHFVMKNVGNTNDAGKDYLLAISLMGFAGREPYEQLIGYLDEAEALGSTQMRAESLEFLLRELPLNPSFDNWAALSVATSGGLERCLDLRIDPEQLLGRILENLRVAEGVSLGDLRKIHSFGNQINNHLFANLAITRKAHFENAESLLGMALDLSKGSDRVMEPPGQLALMNLTASQIVKITSFSSKSDDLMRRRISGYNEKDVKAAIDRLDASVQYQVIDRLEIKDLYTPRELNLITGRRLERDLGF